MRGSKVLPAVLLPFLGLGLGACSDSSTEPALDDVQVIRQATQKYQDLQAAQADGFAPLSPCVASPAGGGMTLVGVEFMVPRDAWYGAGNSAPPAVAGQTFDPPNPQHPDEMLREMYTLHVWAWRDNPSGMFAPFNPHVSCGDDGGSHDHDH